MREKSNLPKIDDHCSRYFTYRQFLECSDTFRTCEVENLPIEPRTYHAIEQYSAEILDKVYGQYPKLRLTYGFCGRVMAQKIKKNIFPKLDQHAGYELNRNGNPICDRGGIACDFIVDGTNSLDLARWVVNNCDYDRIYYYGAARPIHVSHSSAPTQNVILMRFEKVRTVPQKISTHAFLNGNIDF